jgi:hypothetical protein
MSNPNISDAQLAANRANAQKSTGPVTDEGKAKSSLNAVKTGLTGRTVLLPTDDAIAYQEHLNRLFTKHTPAGDDEHNLVQTIADTEWRLLRIHPLEAGIFSLGLRKLAGQFADEPDPINRENLIRTETYVVYRKELSNLAPQERRLRNQRKEDLAELKQLQQERLEKEKKAAAGANDEVARASQMANRAYDNKLPFDPRQFGFDFSYDEMVDFCEADLRHRTITGASLNFPKWLAARRAAQKAA